MDFLWEYESSDLGELFEREEELAELLGMSGCEFESQYFFRRNKYILNIYADIDNATGVQRSDKPGRP